MIVRYPVLRQAVSEYGLLESIAVDIRDVRAVWSVKLDPPVQRPSTLLLLDEGVQLVLAGCVEPTPLLSVAWDAVARDVEVVRRGFCPRCRGALHDHARNCSRFG